MAGSGSGSLKLKYGSGSQRPKNLRIRVPEHWFIFAVTCVYFHIAFWILWTEPIPRVQMFETMQGTVQKRYVLVNFPHSLELSPFSRTHWRYGTVLTVLFFNKAGNILFVYFSMNTLIEIWYSMWGGGGYCLGFYNSIQYWEITGTGVLGMYR